MDDPNINPAWDSIMGDNVDRGTMRLLAIIVTFVILGGTLFWLVS